MALESTAKDALIAEMLGDVGKLHDKVDSLKEVLPPQVDDAVNQLLRTIGALEKCGDGFRDGVTVFVEQAKKDLSDHYDRMEAAASVKAEQNANEIIRALLSRVETQVKETVRKEVSWPVEKSLKDLELRSNVWLQMATCLACGALGAALTLALFQFYPTDSMTQKYGAAVEKVMNKLPPASQKLIKEAADQE